MRGPVETRKPKEKSCQQTHLLVIPGHIGVEILPMIFFVKASFSHQNHFEKFSMNNFVTFLHSTNMHMKLQIHVHCPTHSLTLQKYFEKYAYIIFLLLFFIINLKISYYLCLYKKKPSNKNTVFCKLNYFTLLKNGISNLQIVTGWSFKRCQINCNVAN